MQVIVYLFILFLIPFCDDAFANLCFAPSTSVDSNLFEQDVDTGMAIHAWIVQDQAPVYNCYRKGDVIKKLQIRKIYRIVSGNYNIEHKGKRWSLLIASYDEEFNPQNIVGWVSHDSLIFNENPLLNTDTNIYEKVLIKEGDSNMGRGLRIFDGKDLKTSKEGIEVRTVFYVYDYYPHSASGPSSPKTKSLLISPLSTLNMHLEHEPMLVGWINRSKVSFWNSRLACEFPVGRKIRLTDDKGKVLFRTEKISKPLSYKSLRNPIIGESDDGKYFRIGVFSRLNQNQLKLRRSLTKITTGLEVLFVIDGTRSMTKAFQETLKGVKKIAQTLKHRSAENNLEQPRYGLLFYRDKPSQAAMRYGADGKVKFAKDIPYCSSETTLYRMGNMERLASNLKKQVACDSDRTPAESVYLGLASGVKTCKFLKGAEGKPKRLRVIIHIGDAGDNGRGNLSPAKILSTFKANHIYKYIAIDVSTKKTSPSFKYSVKQIADKLGDKGQFIYRPKDLEKEVSSLLFESYEATERLNSQIDIISRGFAGTSQGRVGVVSSEILEYAKNVIRANNINLDKYSAFQAYVEGYVKKSGQIKQHILVSRTDIELITTFLTLLIETSDVENKKKTWNGFLKLILGEETCVRDGVELSIEDCNKMRNGIPIHAGFMKYTREEFLNLGLQATRDLICEANVVRERFRLLVSDKKAKAILFSDPDNCEFNIINDFDLNGDGFVVRNNQVNRQEGEKLSYIRKAKDTDLVDRYFFKEGGEHVAWIPVKHLDTIDIIK